MAVETLHADGLAGSDPGTLTGASNAYGTTTGTWTTNIDNSSWAGHFTLGSTANTPDATNSVGVLLRARKQDGNGTPTIDSVAIRENGVQRGINTNIGGVTSLTGEDVSLTVSCTGMSGDGTDLEIVIVTTAAGGSPANRAAVQLDYMDVDVNTSAAQTITIGQATETDTAQAMGIIAPKTVTLGQATETDTAQAVTVSVPLSLPFTDDFTGTNGDPWDSTKWPTQGGASTVTDAVDIQNNEGRLYAGTSQGGSWAAATAASITSLTDSTGEMRIIPSTTGGNTEWLYVCIRSSGEQQSAQDGRPATTYYFRFLVNGASTQSYLLRRLSNSEATLDSDILGTNASRNAAEPFYLKWEIEDDASVSGDTDIRYKMWDADGTEPGGWETLTDGSPGALYGTAGVFQLVGRNYTSTAYVDVQVDDVSINALGGAQTIAIGQATETDTSQAITVIAPKTVAFGQSTETDTAQAITVVKPVSVSIGQATETELAQAVTAYKPQTVAVGQVTEADSALAVTAYKPITLAFGQSTETDSAQTITPTKSIFVSVGQVTETDEAQAVTAYKPQFVALGQVTEADSALAVTPDKPQFVAIGQTTETDSAQVVSPIKPTGTLIGQASESDSAQAITVVKPVFLSIGQATEADSAQAVTAYKPIAVSIGQATETDTVGAITPVKPQFVAVGQATETDSAQVITPDIPAAPITVAIGQVTETDTASAITAYKPQFVSIGLASETDTAQGITVVKPFFISVGQATETDFAQAITSLVTGQIVSVGQAQETDAAQSVSVILPKTVTLFQAIETDVALGFNIIKVTTPNTYDPSIIKTVCLMVRHPGDNRVRMLSGLPRGSVVGAQDWDRISPVFDVNIPQLEIAEVYLTSAISDTSADTATIYSEMEAAIASLSYPSY